MGTAADYRDHAKVEVDAVLENRRGETVAIEIKAASTVRAVDFNGLRRLAEKLGDELLVGIVLYTGSRHCRSDPNFGLCRSARSGRSTRTAGPSTMDNRW
jgi:hypothetical protein